MSRDVMSVSVDGQGVAASSDVAAAVAATDWSGCAATVVGYGAIGQQYVQALQALGVRHIRVCSRSAAPLAALASVAGVERIAGGVAHWDGEPRRDELGIVATPPALLVPAAERLVALGFRRLLIEKPVALWSSTIARCASAFDQRGVEAVCAYNRVAYPSVQEARARALREGGMTSCTYTMTELVRPDWVDRFPPTELARWGIANSLHVASMAHSLIGLPATWQGHRAGAMTWHPTGTVFVGSGVSKRGVPFAYHADWGSTGRWSLEIHTAMSSYRCCPLETLTRRTSPQGAWDAVPLTVFAPEVKAGFVEQVASMLNPDIRQMVPLLSLQQAAALTQYGEDIFGYASHG